MNNCRRILVVDDNREVRDSLVEFLGSCGYKVRGVRNGREAIVDLQAASAPTLILLDLMMPVMNGWEFQRAKGQDASLAVHPIVTLTSVNTELDEEARIESEASIKKPVSLADLLTVVRRFCAPLAEPEAHA